MSVTTAKRAKILECHKMIYTRTLDPLQWELTKNEGRSVKFQTILQ